MTCRTRTRIPGRCADTLTRERPAVVTGHATRTEKMNRILEHKTRHAFVLLLAMTLWSCGGSTPAVTAGVVDLVSALPTATVTASADHVASRPAVLAGERQPGIFMHPNSKAEFPPVALGEAPFLTFAIGIDDSVRDKPGDGVDFTVSVRESSGTITELWSKYLDAKRHAADRGWHPVTVSLEKYAGQTISIILSTSIADDGQFDGAYWGTPQLTPDGRESVR